MTNIHNKDKYIHKIVSYTHLYTINNIMHTLLVTAIGIYLKPYDRTASVS